MRHQPQPSPPGDMECTILSLLLALPLSVSNSKSWKACIKTMNRVCPGISPCPHSVSFSSCLPPFRQTVQLSHNGYYIHLLYVRLSQSQLLALHFFPSLSPHFRRMTNTAVGQVEVYSESALTPRQLLCRLTPAACITPIHATFTHTKHSQSHD